MMDNMERFLEKKPVVTVIETVEEGRMVLKPIFKLIVETLITDEDEIEGTGRRSKYEVITKELSEAKAFKGYSFIKLKGNRLFAYKDNYLTDIFEIDPDNTIYKIVDDLYKVDIIDIENETFMQVKIVDDDIIGEEPYFIGTGYEDNFESKCKVLGVFKKFFKKKSR